MTHDIHDVYDMLPASLQARLLEMAHDLPSAGRMMRAIAIDMQASYHPGWHLAEAKAQEWLG